MKLKQVSIILEIMIENAIAKFNALKVESTKTTIYDTGVKQKKKQLQVIEH